MSGDISRDIEPETEPETDTDTDTETETDTDTMHSKNISNHVGKVGQKIGQTSQLRIVTKAACAVAMDGHAQIFPPFSMRIRHSGQKLTLLKNTT